jgi:hypothetical protein
MSTSPPPTATGSSKLDAVKAKTMAAHIDPTAPTGANLYARFAFAGAVCCSITHGGLTPVDVYVMPPLNGTWDVNGCIALEIATATATAICHPK